MKLPEGFAYNRIVPSEWQRELALLTPRQERTTWLQLAWHAGDPWAPVQRWAIYEMVPLAVWGDIIRGQMARGLSQDEIMECFILEALQGPNPRDLGYYDQVLGRFVTESLVTRQEWELFREHRAIPKLYWIIQGEHGGHKRHFSPIEQKYLTLAGLPTDPPLPGELPYAPFDRRVLEQLARRDRLQHAKDKLSGHEDERSTQMVELRRQLVSWLEDQMKDVLESTKLDLTGIPRTSDDPTAAIEAATARFIETGRST